MKIKIFLLAFTLISVQYIFSQIPPGYYDGATGTGDVLRADLESIIDGHNAQSYDALWTHFQTTDVDNYYENDGSVMDMYSENPSGTDPYNFTFITDQCGNYGGEGDCYNREHSFPKSWFNDASPMYTDLFHLVPTDGYVNGIRSNYAFGETDNPNYTSQNGSKRGPCSYPGYTDIIFEPIDEFKGDFARSYFYMATRYYTIFDNFSSPMQTGDNYSQWAKNMLLEWHELDPVSQKEIDRNNAIYGIQGNRNPYIDHPEWACMVFGTDCPGYVEDPSDFIALAISESQINLTWNLNTDNDDVLLAYNTSNTFGDPVGAYTAGQSISGGGEVLLAENETAFNHSGLSSQTYYYKLWSANSSDEYSSGIETSAMPLYPEPSNNVTSFSVVNETSNSISLTWTDALGSQLPEAYLVKASTGSISPPADGVPEPDGQFVKNIDFGVETVTFSGLLPSTTYFFEIFPYTNSGININYKTDDPATAVGNTTSGSSVIFSGSFETGLDGWVLENNGVDPEWLRTDDGGIYSPGDLGHDGTYYMWYYGWNGNADDWLISPLLDFTGYTDAKFEFWSWMRNEANEDLLMKISTDYPGSGDPSLYTWTNLSPVFATSEFTWTNSGEVDLVAFNGLSCYVAFHYSGTDVDRNWAIDDITVTGIAESSNDNDSEVSDPPVQISGSNISSLIDTEEEAVEVFAFSIEDLGTSDYLITQVLGMRLYPGSSNTADWTDHIQAIKVNDGTQDIVITNQTITDSYINLTCNPYDILDNSSVTFTVSVCLNVSNIQDESILSFMIDADNHGFIASSSYSLFNSVINSGVDIVSDNFEIDVTGTDLVFTLQPSDTEVNQVMDPSPVVQIQDENGNTDLSYIEPSVLFSDGIMSGEPIDGVWNNGNLTFGDLIHTQDVYGIRLSVLSGFLDKNSDLFNIYCIPENVSDFNVECGNTQAEVLWTNSECSDEIMIVVNDESITGVPQGTYIANSNDFQDGLNPDFPNGGKVVYTGSESPQSITGLENGTDYYFKLFTYAYGLWSTGIEISCMPLKINQISNEFDVYPIPAEDRIFIKNNHSEFSEISLYDIYGKRILNISSEDRITVLNISEFSKGIYFLNIKSCNTEYIKKIIVN